MKVLFIIPTAFPNNRGSPARVYEMCQALTRRGVECHVVSYGAGEDRKTSATIHKTAKLPVYRKGIGPSYSRILLDILLVFKVLRLCSQWKFDIIHAHLHEGALASLPVRLFHRIPIVFDIHSSLADELASQNFASARSPMGVAARLLDRWLPCSVGACVCLSHNVARRFRILHPEHRVDVIPNATDLSFFRVFESRLRAELGLRGRFVVGYQGNMSPMQRLDMLLDAAPTVLAVRQDVMFLVGHTSDPTSALAEVERRGLRQYFTFLETPFDKAPEVINACDVMVIPRNEASAPMKLSNFVACGRPVVLHENVACGVTEHPEEGGMYSFVDSSSLAKVILTLGENPDLRSAAGLAARRFAEREFSHDVLAERMIRLYESLTIKPRLTVNPAGASSDVKP